MNAMTKSPPFDLRRALTCAGLATLATLATFSLIANVMRPLMAEGPALAAAPDNVCVAGSSQTMHAVATAQPSAI